MRKTYRVTLSVVRIACGETKEEAIERAKSNYDDWYEEGTRHSWDKTSAKEIVERG